MQQEELWEGLKMQQNLMKNANYITKKEGHKNFCKIKNVDINIIYKSYFIIFFVKPTYAKL